MSKNYKELLNNVKAFVFDVDGVFTDGTVLTTETGEQYRVMRVKDGFAVQNALKKGYPIGVISGGSSESVRQRFEYLGVTDLYLGINDKSVALKDFCFKHQLEPSAIAYMGDDIPDLSVLKNVGLACCPKDAAVEVKEICHYISPYYGGSGCVRDLISQVMKVQNKW